eukprot:2792547-Pleurochrysis_carterae.AAC.1
MLAICGSRDYIIFFIDAAVTERLSQVAHLPGGRAEADLGAEAGGPKLRNAILMGFGSEGIMAARCARWPSSA